MDKIKTIVFDPPEEEIAEGEKPADTTATITPAVPAAAAIKAVTPQPVAAVAAVKGVSPAPASLKAASPAPAAVKAVSPAPVSAIAAIAAEPTPDATTILDVPEDMVAIEKTPEPEELPIEPLMPPHRLLRIEPRYILNVAPDYVRRHVPPSMEDIQRVIKTKLSFATYLTNRLFALGSQARLSCLVRGPDPNAKWSKDGQPISNGTVYKTTANDGLFKLEFVGECKPEHAGIYAITVRNGDCTISGDCTVSVFQPQLVADLVPTFTRNLKREF